MRELLGGFPRPPSSGRPSTSATTFDSKKTQGVIATLAHAHVELLEDLEKEKKKRHSRDKLLVRVWKGVKAILKHLSPSSHTPKVSMRALSEFSFRSEFEKRAAGDAGSGSDEASN